MNALKNFPISLGFLALVVGLWFGAGHPGSAAQRQSDGAVVEKPAEADFVRVPTLKRQIARYEIIGPDDIIWIKTNVRRLPRNALIEARHVIGMAAKRNLSAGRAILARDLSEPLTIKKGDIVSIVYTTPHMTLTARGRALENAKAGEGVRALNAHSQRTVEATAIAPGIVATRPLTHAELAEAMR